MWKGIRDRDRMGKKVAAGAFWSCFLINPASDPDFLYVYAENSIEKVKKEMRLKRNASDGKSCGKW